MNDRFLQQFPFPLDDFQREAIGHIARDHSVVVCAPTGSGKTVIAEYAALKAIDEGVKVFYTTPLKALSNQKYYDFKARFGEQNVGLLTGDMSVNREGRIVVMTTEVFRNMLYGLNEDSTLLDKVGYVVLDECHFMNDASRGTVWEESIIYCPRHIKIIALSATVANAEELTRWIDNVHGNTHLVKTDFRPVPLRYSFFTKDRLYPLFEAPGRLNKKLKVEHQGHQPGKKFAQFVPNRLIEAMHERDMLPAIFFTFSRKRCDDYLRATGELRLLKPDERDRLNALVDDHIQQHPYLADNALLDQIRNGCASHHAGLLPAMKLLVESLFQQGLLKVVFATETLAAGINMPARSTVITSISKRSDEGHRLLTASEFLQMSGRAGRRGMDEIGYVVVVSTPQHSAQEAAILASSPADALNSQFTPTYGMVLNLLQRYSLDESQYLVQKSFGQFTSQRRVQPLADDLAEKQRYLDEAVGFQCPYGLTTPEFHGFIKNKERIHALNKQIHILRKQAKRHPGEPELVAAVDAQFVQKRALLEEMAETPCYNCELFSKHRRLDERVDRLQKQVRSLDMDIEQERNLYWQQFTNIYRMLKSVGYIDDNDKPTAQGLLTCQIRTENEVYLAELISRGIFDELPPESLAAVVSMVVFDSTRENLYTQIKWSRETRRAFGRMQNEFKRLKHLQEQARVNVPLILNPVASGLVEGWAKGYTWDGLMATTNVDQGDLVRILRRTIDLLRQISRLAEIPYELALSARQAFLLLNRDPVKEVDLSEEDLPIRAQSGNRTASRPLTVVSDPALLPDEELSSSHLTADE